jgi:hypothetical protein
MRPSFGPGDTRGSVLVAAGSAKQQQPRRAMNTIAADNLFFN